MCCTTMASLCVLAFDHEGRPIQSDTWLDNMQLYLLSDSRDTVSLFDHTSGAAPAPPATADSATRSHLLLLTCHCCPIPPATALPVPRAVHLWVESVHTRYRASSGICVCPGVRVRSASTPLLVSPPIAPDSRVAPPPGSPLPATPAWHALPPPCLWSSQGCERYFLLVVDDYTRYTTVFPLRSKDRGGEFSSDLLRDFCRGEGIPQSFTLPDSPQQNGIAERRIGLVMEVARISMIYAATPHFLWSFAVRYAAHQLNLSPRVSLPETSPTLRWTGKVGDASVFRSVPFYRLFPYRSAPPPPPPLFLAPGPPPIDPLPPQGLASSGVSQVDPLSCTMPVEVAGDSGAAQGAVFGGAERGGAEPGGAEPGRAESKGAGSGDAERGGAEPWGAVRGGAEPVGVEPRGAEPEGVEPGGAESEGAESGGAEPRGAALCGGPAGALPRLSLRPETLSP
ncbi:unnamed protein product [Closterium sp. NIES-53]